MDEINKVDTQASENQEKNIEKDVDSTDTEDEEETEEEESTEIDYQAEYERLTEENVKKTEQLDKAGHAIEKAKREAKESTSIDTEEIAQMVEEQVSKRMGAVEKTALHTSAETIASQMASGVDEAKLIMYHYTNSIIPSGNLSEDVANAQALANRKRNVQELGEARRALASKGNEGDGSGAGQKKQVSQVPKLSPKDAGLIENAKMKWNSKTERFEGKYAALKWNDATKAWESISLREE